MVEFQLLQRDQRAIAFLDKFETPPVELARLVQSIAIRCRLPQERPRDERDREQREHRAQHEREGHAEAVAYRSLRRRCSTASGHMATSEPKTNRKPAAQMRLTSGFTSALR